MTDDHSLDRPREGDGGKVHLAAMVLAAGYSSRMGAFKPLLTLGGRTAVESCVRLFHNAGVEDIAVVVGYRAQEVVSVAECAGACCVQNPDYATGMFSSVLAGTRWLPPGVESCFVLPADMPLVRPSTVRRMIDAYVGAGRRSSILSSTAGADTRRWFRSQFSAKHSARPRMAVSEICSAVMRVKRLK